MAVKIPPPLSPLEELLALQIRSDKLPPPKREFKFKASRKWMFDFAWDDPCYRLAVEVEGGIHSGGRHTDPKGFERDAEKYNEAALMGWVLLRFTSGMIRRGEAISTLKRALLLKESECL